MTANKQLRAQGNAGIRNTRPWARTSHEFHDDTDLRRADISVQQLAGPGIRMHAA
ncbi:hypothetical protein OG864_22575 [Streptomyces sp. NBC_00124]|uniref:hypothetical protein n=1 Tax=Streptomyces sp. NBC_00124 TaxID=2975662 RepID=UPI00224D0BDF|nr:hypothetical protein [Streptomyces sp. NBC_00124]MCX5361497.1 hypothetical protein [Streptomyces sp. NBC_00124]